MPTAIGHKKRLALQCKFKTKKQDTAMPCSEPKKVLRKKPKHTNESEFFYVYILS